MSEFREKNLILFWHDLIYTTIMSDPNGPGTASTRDEPDIASGSGSVRIDLNQLESRIETLSNMFRQRGEFFLRSFIYKNRPSMIIGP